jgi:hypothetical protein
MRCAANSDGSGITRLACAYQNETPYRNLEIYQEDRWHGIHVRRGGNEFAEIVPQNY